MSNVSNRVIIFSVFRPEFKGHNLENHKEILNIMSKHGAIEVEGCYKGETELSIMVPYKNVYMLRLIKRIAKMYNQESILITSGDRTATLVYQDETEMYLGQLISVSKDIALKQDAYTYVPKQDAYFITQ